VHTSPRVNAQTSTPHVGAGVTVASIWSSQSGPYRAVGQRRPATASWPPVRPWSLEGDTTTPWSRTMPPERPLTESGMSTLLYAVA
jgi:hypothetical protein